MSSSFKWRFEKNPSPKNSEKALNTTPTLLHTAVDAVVEVVDATEAAGEETAMAEDAPAEAVDEMAAKEVAGADPKATEAKAEVARVPKAETETRAAMGRGEAAAAVKAAVKIAAEVKIEEVALLEIPAEPWNLP